MRFLNDLNGVGAILGLTVESELVDGRRLVQTEPFAQGVDGTRDVDLQVVDVVNTICQRIFGRDSNYLPVGLSIVNEGQNTEDLHTDDGAGLPTLATDLHHVHWIIVTGSVGIGGDVVGVFPSLGKGTVVEEHVSIVVVTEHTVLGVLLDRVEGLTSGDFELLTGPLGDLHDHVVGAVSVEKRDIVPRRDLHLAVGGSIVEVHAILQRREGTGGLSENTGNGRIGDTGLHELELRLIGSAAALQTFLAAVVLLGKMSAVPIGHEVIEVDAIGTIGNDGDSFLCLEIENKISTKRDSATISMEVNESVRE